MTERVVEIYRYRYVPGVTANKMRFELNISKADLKIEKIHQTLNGLNIAY